MHGIDTGDDGLCRAGRYRLMPLVSPKTPAKVESLAYAIFLAPHELTVVMPREGLDALIVLSLDSSLLAVPDQRMLLAVTSGEIFNTRSLPMS
ncbi:hypothetical protein [Streptomyces sp. NPDC048489]|uniref:hypothetical protein n=1 Tax=Streptomyces sp. NPDC048489 TaxID=3154504 RepID=UPI00341755C5